MRSNLLGCPSTRTQIHLLLSFAARSDDDVDSKTISKWARALRYFARCKAPGTRVKTSMKPVGAVNACAYGYTNKRQNEKLCGRRAEP